MMPMPHIMLDNQTSEAIHLVTLGLTLPASGSALARSDRTTVAELQADVGLCGEVDSGNVTLTVDSVSLTTAQSQTYLRPAKGVKANSTSTSPTATDDSTAGYSTGSHWVNTATNTAYVCTDATPGVAVWVVAGSTGILNPWMEDEFVASAGQITFLLTQAPIDAGSFTFSVNGVLYDDVDDYTRSGATVTWLNNVFVMDTGDKVLARYI